MPPISTRDDDDLVALELMEQVFAESCNSMRLLAQAASLTAARNVVDKAEAEDDSSETEKEGPGRGNTADGLAKAAYARRTNGSFYERVREHDSDVLLFDKLIHFSRDEFDVLLGEVSAELSKPMKVRLEITEEGNALRCSRKRRLTNAELLFMFLYVLGSSDEGSIGAEHIAMAFNNSIGTVSNYFRHALFSVYNALQEEEPPLIRWPDAEERSEMEGLIIGFRKCVFFVDGNKNKRWRPNCDEEQERAYDGYKRAHAFSILDFCDIFGRFIRLEISDKGPESDRMLYTESDVYQNPAEYLSEGQHGMADMGFSGDGDIVVPYKANESTDWLFRGEHNRDIRKQRMTNEWGIGYVNNHHRLFLGRWPFEKRLFPVAYKTAAMLANWRFDARGYALQTVIYCEATGTRRTLSARLYTQLHQIMSLILIQ